ncbi:N-acetylneuraminate synthase family protein [Devosia oryziradicis]|uniref:N-acetylneuraminate synthase family protein n=1 Tax=Devosia oryziradicis TaxID=2801335 RepID=A0ABX7BZV1_9HYPH|nr:N-acetylneuraminate synthase family protein [Devosia oryziradicis]QQR35336.1 N-acetylneuraminate synthase family protein [Devosia oryziradicis]
MNQPFNIGRTAVGPGHPPAFFPDIDVYFKADLGLALDLVARIAASGATVLKGAIIHDVTLAAPHGDTQYFVPGRGMVQESYRAVLERHVVRLSDLEVIMTAARDAGLDLVMSIYDDEGLAFARDMQVDAVKVASSNIVHAPLIRSLSATGLPLIIDTGRSSMDEIARAVGWARAAGAEKMLIQHSPPGPPAAVSAFNLRMMAALGKTHATLCGLSDHDQGTESVLTAVALGAHALEKGIRADAAHGDIDLAHALPISQLPELLQRIERVYQSLGDSQRSFPADRPRPPDRMGLVANADLPTGTALSRAKVRFSFPAAGLGVEMWDSVEGRRLARPLTAGQPIVADDIDDGS